MTIVALVFARGGSKGLPGKNIKELNGLPLLAYSILMAKSHTEIAAVYVSTDDAEIARVATHYGANVIQRPEALATDSAKEWDAWRHAVNYLKKNGQLEDGDVFLSLPATAPLRKREDIDQCLKKYASGEYDAIITMANAYRNPYFNMVEYKDDDSLGIVIPQQQAVSRRQDTREVFDVTTVAYVTSPEFILNHDNLFEGKVGGCIVPSERSLDIDTPMDFKIAEALVAEIDPLKGMLKKG